MTALIYALLDPDTKDIRYVGKTRKGLRQRLGDHISLAQRGKGTYKYNWIRELMSHGRIPEIVILEVVPDGEDWKAYEQKWIGRGRESGWQLTNLTDGGEGKTGWLASDETKEKLRAAWVERRKRGVSDETRARLSKARKGKKLSPEHAKNNAEARKGMVFSEERKKNISLSLRGENSPTAKITEVDVREIRKRYEAGGITQRDLGKEYGLHNSTVSEIVRRKRWGHVK